MSASRTSVVIVALFALSSGDSEAQVTVKSLSASTGVIRTQTDADGYRWALYPQAELGGQLFVSYLYWGVSWGYWSDGIDRALPVTDFVTYSQSGHIISERAGVKIQSLASSFPLPLIVFLGFSEHFVETSYVGGSDGISQPRQASTDLVFAGLVGIRLTIPIASYLEFQAEALQFIPVGENSLSFAQINRRAFSLGLAVTF